MTTSLESIKNEILEQMPLFIEQDPAFCAALARALRGEFVPRDESESRFDMVLRELRQDREEQRRKWDEQNLKWEENQLELKRLHEEVMAVSKKVDRTVGGLGARWGMMSERAFRNALAGILEKSFGVRVLNITEYDSSGEVFGRPDQIELDVIIKNGLLIICELKSSMDKSAMYAFERKARFYEKLQGRKADRLIVVSPMIDPLAKEVGARLNIEMYTDSIHVPVSC